MSKSRDTLKILAPALLGTTALLTVAASVADRMIVHPGDGSYRMAAGQVIAAVEDAATDALTPNAAQAQDTVADTTPMAGMADDSDATEPDVAGSAAAEAGGEMPATTPLAGMATADASEATGTDLARDGGFGLGRPALEAEVAAWDIDIRPDGTGLPVGSGDVWTGEEVWVDNCAMCHGDFGEAVGRWPVIAGGWDTLDRADPVKTVGSYWPYLSTVYDYIYRAMPFGNAQSLEADQVYALTAYILYLNNVVEDDFELSNETFLDVQMPNADGFFLDDRAETELTLFSAEPCMTDCKDAVEITMRAAVLDVTPETEEAKVEAAAEAPVAAVSATDMAVEGNATVLEVAEAETAEPEVATEGTVEVAAEAEEVAALDPEMVEAGSKVFRQCQACHAVGEGAANKVGPQLNGVVGRTAGSVEDFRYSNAMMDANAEGLIWNAETLGAYLEDPRGYMKGTKMSYRGLRAEEDRAAIIAFLQSHAD
ncbi:Cytochrome c2 [Rhodobacteraceae bacterium THAF1]|uniref:c-type cytochrome n=1 Tax=Palleronia sp. THAF1 TaxID=2587842 RepID=UPI000F3F4AE1|nr:c-type cytochrome [Palleronia sp. THAF1]QFU09059.1 Cytochrome c2 [Palleronia sp. THAF1]VDC24141.1 Cytochrome c2 [Rhodobacteraceae bacterium THAF1]